MKEKIAIVEDDRDIRKLVEIILKNEGFIPVGFEKGEDFLNYIKKSLPDLLILDIMLPDMDGFEICKILRARSDTSFLPIIILSARGDETDIVLGLEIGADDYVRKPFSSRELIARIRANLRRRKNREGIDEIIINDLKIFPEKYEVLLKGEKIPLTTTEFKILLLLAKGKGKVFSRQEIIEALWRGEKFILDRTVDVHIKKLRSKLKEAGKMIKSIRGVGYKLES